MKNLIIFAALVIGLSSCTSTPIKVLTIQRMDGKIEQVRSTMSMNGRGDSIMVKEVFSSNTGAHTEFYGNFGNEKPEDYFSSDSTGTFSIHYEPAVVLKVEVD